MGESEFVLSTLSKVELRSVWTSEAGDFTPWLAREESLKILGDVIRIDLEHEATEKRVGPFRADILCKDTNSGDWVLIENQIEKTDHTHLGQLMTYAAGLKAATVVWIASRFTDEHRAAMDWLNEITSDTLNFIGLEIELWRIGESPVAPKFNVVCKPNDWSRTVGNAAHRIEERGLSDTLQLQLDYWSAFREFLLDRGSSVKPQKPRPQHWMNFAVGRSFFSLATLVNTQSAEISVVMECSGSDASAHYHLLLDQRDAIEDEIGVSLDWCEMPGKKTSKIMVAQQSDPLQRDDWERQHEWLSGTLERFYSVFNSRVKVLNSGEFTSASDETESP